MSIVVVTSPPEILSLANLKTHLRVDHSDDDEYISALGEAAQQWIDGPTGWLGRSIGIQTLELRVESFCCRSRGNLIQLRYPPVVEVLSVKYLDNDGVEQTVNESIYGLAAQSVLYTKPGKSWPKPSTDPEAVRVRYTAGYAKLPAPIKQAMLLLVGQWYNAREAVNIGNIVNELPFTVEALLSPFRVWSV